MSDMSAQDLSSALGVYVHWPYCSRICPYCDFNVYRPKNDGEDLVAAICRDLEAWREKTGGRPLTSLHFGGGTPSLMSPHQVERVIATADRLWGLEPDAEIGLEANPNEAGRFAELVAAGINRLSLGVQSLDTRVLARLGRDHDTEMARRAVDSAQATDARVSVDMIYAHSGQTLEAWSAELDRVIGFGTGHVSAYQLTIEPGTAFGKRADRGEVFGVEEDLAADLYELTDSRLTQAGLALYEISNFARSAGDQSRHNRLYWEGGDWVGVGPGAHGRLGRACGSGRLSTAAHRRPADYVSAVVSGGTGVDTAETLTAEDERAERILMGLRIALGLDRAILRRTTGLDVDEAQLDRFERNGLLIREGDRLRLTPEGRLLADGISMALVP